MDELKLDNAAESTPPFWQRLHFVWTMLWVGIFAIPLSVIQACCHVFRPGARNFKLWATIWSKASLLMSGLRVNVKRSPNLDPDQPFVFVSNHQSGLDILAHLVAIDVPFGFVAKQELKKVPFIGLALRFSASLFVDRSTARKAVKSMHEAAERIKGGNSVLIYPEGRRTWSTQTAPFLKGAFQLATKAGVPIVPIAILNAHELYDARRIASKPGTVELIIGDPLETSELTRPEIIALAEHVRSVIQAELDDFHSA